MHRVATEYRRAKLSFQLKFRTLWLTSEVLLD